MGSNIHPGSPGPVVRWVTPRSGAAGCRYLPSMPPLDSPKAPSAPTVPPAVKGLALVSRFNDFASEMVYPLLPAFVTRSLGGGAALLGLLDGAADLTSALLKLVSGRLA